MATHVLIVQGHPRTASFCGALADVYRDEAIRAGAEVRRLELSELTFDPVCDVPYWEEGWTADKLEPDLVHAMEDIRWADRITWVYPLWWGFMPALLKGFLDRVMTVPDFASVYDEYGRPVGLLKPRRSTLVITMDAPVVWERFVMHNRGAGVMRSSILKLCGIRTDQVVQIGSMLKSTPESRGKALDRIRRAARRDAK